MLALRVLTDPRGRVQTVIVAFIEELLRRDIEEFGLVTLIEPGALAYALVRLGESFLYADVLAARKPDVETAGLLQHALFEASCRNAAARRTPASRSVEDVVCATECACGRASGELGQFGLHHGLVLLLVPAWRRAAATGRAAAGC